MKSFQRIRKHILPLITAFFVAAGTASVQSALSGNPARATQPVHTFAGNSVLSEGKWVKVALNGNEDGIYQIPYSQLRQMGFSRPEKVGVFGFGGHILDEAFSSGHIDDLPEVAVCHDAGRQRILFYGRGLITWQWKNDAMKYSHRQHPYANQAVYFLRETEDPRRMDTIRTEIPTGINADNSFDEHLLHETESVNIGKTGRELYGESFVYTQAQRFNFSMPGIVNDTVLVTANVIANSKAPSTYTVKLNNTTAGSVVLSAITDDYNRAREGTINKSIRTTTDKIAVDVTYTPGGATPVNAHLNYIRIQGKRKIALYDMPYTLFRRKVGKTASQLYAIDNFDEAGMQVWDITSPADISIQTVSNKQFASPDADTHEYALIDLRSTNFPGVTFLGEVANQNLHALPQTEMVIIAPPGHLTQAERLAEYRRSHDNLHVTVVTPECIYNEFSSGVPDATAYRLFLKMFYDRGKTALSDRQLRYLLLFGDGFYNNRQVAGSNFYLLTYESEPSLAETASYVCDDYFGFLDDAEGGKLDAGGRYSITSDVIDIGIGRLPVSNAEEAKNVVDKTIGYSDNRYYGNWKNRICFLGDDDKITDKTKDSPNTHIRHCDSMVYILQHAGHHEFVYQKIYLPAYTQTTTASGTDYPDAKKEFLETLRQGVLLINYAGHGNTSSITNEGLMTTATAATLNMKKLPVWITATCDFSRYDDDETSCGETLLLNPNGGAVALITTSRVVYASQNLTLNRHLIRHIFDRHSDGTRYRLGDIMRQAKRDMGTETNKLNYCLLGDPSLILAYPENEMELTAINGETVAPTGTAPNFSLPALSRVTMRGRVLKVGSQETDTEFNGLLYPTIYDAEEVFTADKGLYQDPVFSFKNRTKKVFSGRDVIRNGEFEFSFVVPQDIAYSDGNGLVNLYACSEEGNEGQGYFNRLYLNGSNDTEITDTIGPEIRQLILNVRNFQSGDVVNATPYFFAEAHDPSGFNTTGNSIGHDITLTLRNLSNPLTGPIQYLLNSYFTSYTGDATTGNVRFSIPQLEDGDYEATFRIWDVYNNSSASTFHFTVDTRKAVHSAWIQAYPSPAYTGEPVTFRVMHNRPEAQTTLRVQVFTQTGTKVWEGETSSNAADIVYTPDAAHPDRTDQSLGNDESDGFLGASTILWNQRSLSGSHLAPGLYIYRVYISSNGSTEVSKSKKLLIIGGNKTEDAALF